MRQIQVQTQTKPTAGELIKEIAVCYVNERGWADVMEILPILDEAVWGKYKLMLDILTEMQKQALQDKHCPYCGEELEPVAVEGYQNYGCPKCGEIWQEGEVGSSENINSFKPD